MSKKFYNIGQCAAIHQMVNFKSISDSGKVLKVDTMTGINYQLLSEL